MNRRSFLAATLGAAVAIPAATRRLDRSRVSAITDEVSRSQAESIDFAHKYGLQCLSLRDIPCPLGAEKIPYYSLPPDAMQQVAHEFKDAGIRIAFLDTPFLKFDLPGTEPTRSKPEDPAARDKRVARNKALFDSRLEDLRQGIRASHTFECPLVRIFTFTRVAEPESTFPRLADIIGEMAAIADKDGIKLLIENETTQNAGTSAETAKLLKLLPANVGINWDSLNAVPLGEKSYPDGYESVPKDRIWNVHVKGKSLLDYPDHLDWPTILNALDRDGFTGSLELETHIFGEEQIAASHASMKELLRLLDARSNA
jgi:sugar phosphate isomerase/epimerase